VEVAGEQTLTEGIFNFLHLGEEHCLLSYLLLLDVLRCDSFGHNSPYFEFGVASDRYQVGQAHLQGQDGTRMSKDSVHDFVSFPVPYANVAVISAQSQGVFSDFSECK
jgi:hypothetical protein